VDKVLVEQVRQVLRELLSAVLNLEVLPVLVRLLLRLLLLVVPAEVVCGEAVVVATEETTILDQLLHQQAMGALVVHLLSAVAVLRALLLLPVLLQLLGLLVVMTLALEVATVVAAVEQVSLLDLLVLSAVLVDPRVVGVAAAAPDPAAPVSAVVTVAEAATAGL
jgi:hypothetical protein